MIWMENDFLINSVYYKSYIPLFNSDKLEFLKNLYVDI